MAESVSGVSSRVTPPFADAEGEQVSLLFILHDEHFVFAFFNSSTGCASVAEFSSEAEAREQVSMLEGVTHVHLATDGLHEPLVSGLGLFGVELRRVSARLFTVQAASDLLYARRYNFRDHRFHSLTYDAFFDALHASGGPSRSERLQMRAIGGLVRAVEEISAAPIRSFTQWAVEACGGGLPLTPSPSAHLSVDPTATTCLHISVKEAHPSTGRPKDSLSIFSVVNRTRCALGSRLLRHWLTHPLKDVGVIEARLDAITAFTSPSVAELIPTLCSALGRVSEPRSLLHRMERSQANVAVWSRFFRCFSALVEVGSVCAQLSRRWGRNAPASVRLLATIPSSPLPQLLKDVYSTLVLHTPAGGEPIVTVRPTVDPALDVCRTMVSSMDSVLSSFTERERALYPDFLQPHLTLVYVPYQGVHVAFPVRVCADLSLPYTASLAAAAAAEGGGGAAPFLDFCFASTAVAYFRSPHTKHLDEAFGDVYGKMGALIRRKVLEMEEKVTCNEVFMLVSEMSPAIAELDCLQSLACSFLEYGWCRPRIGARGSGVCIEGAYHPLYRIALLAQSSGGGGSDFVPSDILFGVDAEHPRVVMLTGPNGSGKSAFVRTVGVCCWLALVGCFVPASAAVVPAFDGIFIRISTPRDALLATAAEVGDFGSELQSVKEMVECATPHSLCLLDELGAGTLSFDGIALLAAVLDSLLSRSPPPVVLVASHMLEVLSQVPRIFGGVDSEHFGVASMRVLIQDGEEVVHDGHDRVCNERRECEVTRGVSAGHVTRGGHSMVGAPDFVGGDGAAGGSIAPTLTFLYTVEYGHIEKSHAVSCARIVGLPTDVIERAADICERLVHGGSLFDAAACLKGSIVEAVVDMVRDTADPEELLMGLRRLEAVPI